MKTKRELLIRGVRPLCGVPGGELTIDCRGFKPESYSKVLFGEVEAAIASASQEKIRVWLPDNPNSLGLALQVGQARSEVFPFNLATQLAGNLHPVSNPAIAPDGAAITTISGSRGQQIPQPLVRVTRRGDKLPFHCEIMNPTGLAFSSEGQLYITSRHEGTVLRYTNFEQLDVIAEDLGTPCGLVFDSKGFLYVGDRTGRIVKIDPSGNKEDYAELEPSISAYHLAIDAEDRLYVTGPTFSMRDKLMRLPAKGKSEVLIEGLARPQGMAFLPNGDLLLCAGFQGKKGVFCYSPAGGSIQHLIAAPMMVGLAVSGQDIFLAGGSSIYYLQLPGQNPVN
ncbi:MAG: IPT/TIG domain-containing protein [Acidobacteria bacterium]|nr:IPT/TIG domain-containing protein [Acidobacteriota bacterium]